MTRWEQFRVKRVLAAVGVAVLALALPSCGGSNTQTPPNSGITTRAFISNSFSGQLLIVNYATDKVAGFVSGVSGLGPIFVKPGQSIALVFNTTNNTLTVVNNSTERITGFVPLPNWSDSMVANSAGDKAYAAIRNALPSGGSVPGELAVVDITNSTISSTVDIPLARRVILGNNGAMLLVLSDNSDSATLVDTSTLAKTPVPGLDRPVAAFFNSDDTKAFILNCGTQCGGTQAGVAVVDVASATVTATLPVDAANVGLLEGTTLYVAGPVGLQGRLTTLDVSGAAPVAQNTVTIGGGTHGSMALADNKKLFVGARDCANNPNLAESGCLSIVDTSSHAVVVDAGKGFVTGMTAIPNRNIVYVVEGGELLIYDATTNEELVGQSINIVGQAVDVKRVD